jgi:NADH-quinone oxidoreductase subunit C
VADERAAAAGVSAALSGLDASVSEEFGSTVVDVPRGAWAGALARLRDACGLDWFDWLSAVDELDRPVPGIRLVCRAQSAHDHRGVLVRTLLPAGDLRAPTAAGVWAGAAWHERETAEMFGVSFDGAASSDPLLLPAGFAGHPLRKDFGLSARAERPWPGAIEPGSSTPGRRRPPGLPAAPP